MQSRRSLFLLAFVVLLLAATANAAQWTFNVNMDGLQEVGPNASPGYGSAVVLYDDLTGAMNVNGTFTGLVANTTASHIHGFSPVGVNSGVIIPLTVDPGTSGNVFGNGNIANSANVLGGLTYLNIHTTAFPGGEIRGQLINPVPEPATCVMVALGALGLLTFGRRVR